MSTHNCKWLDCGEKFNTSSLLASHVRSAHVDSGASDLAVCLWEGCRVYNQPSINRSWLTRHVATHTKEKMFKCLIEACAASFSTRAGLARHMPMHFGDSPTNTTPTGSSSSTAKSNGPPKPRMRYRAGVQYLQQSEYARQWRWGYVDRLVKCPGSDASHSVSGTTNFSDPFDGDAMEAVRNAAIAAELRDLGIGTPDHSKVEDAKEPGQVAEERDQKAVVRLEGSVVARRVINGSDAMSVLVKWSPAGLCGDEWVEESSAPYTKAVPKPDWYVTDESDRQGTKRKKEVPAATASTLSRRSMRLKAYKPY